LQVEVPILNPGKKKYELKAGIISVVDSSGKEVFHAKIRRGRGSYRVTSHTRRINGIRETSLQESDCEDAEVVYSKLLRILDGKLIVGVELEEDFNSMDLEIGHFKVFDLQWYYYRLTYSINHKPIIEKLGIRSLCMHFFNVDMQGDDKPHDCCIDAQYSVRLFLEVYCKISPAPETKDCNLEGTNFIEHFKK